MTALLVTLGAVKALLAVAIFGDVGLDPDTALYAQGGLGLFPSPFGRLVGVGGYPALVAVNVAANALLVLAVIRLAGRSLAGVLVLLSPLGVWSIFAGMDTIAAALLVLSRTVTRRARVLCELAAIGFHLAALLVVFFLRLEAGRRTLAIAVAWLGLCAAMLTPYRGLVLDVDPVVIVTAAIATTGVYLLTFAPFVLRLRSAVPAIAGGAIAAGLVAGQAWETNCRYMLPAVALGAADAFRGAS